jgi:outer membrane lipoprotein-sorting protein
MKNTSLPRTRWFALALILLAPLPALRAGIDETVQALLDRSLAALGDPEAMSTVQSMRATVTNEIPAMGVTMNGTLLQKQPNLFLMELDMPGLGKTYQGFDGQVGWAADPMQGYRELEGSELEQMQTSARLDRFSILGELYPTMELLPDTEIDGRKVHAIRAVAKSGAEETWYYDAETLLPFAWDIVIDAGPAGQLLARMVFSDWQQMPEVDMKVPMTTIVNNPAFQIVSRVLKIEINVEIDEAAFAPRR